MRPRSRIHRWIHFILGASLALATWRPALAGGGQGLSPAGNFVVPSPTLALDGFGSSLAFGDFDGNGIADLAVGSWGLPDLYQGRVDLFLGDGVGLSYAGSYVGNALSFTGYSLAAGDFDGDGKDEIAAGAPTETVAAQEGAGQVLVLAWTGSQVTLVTAFDQGMIGETPEMPDYFGAALARGDFNHDGVADLAIGAYDESLGGASGAGLVHVLYGAQDLGLSASGAQVWTQDSAGVLGASGPQDNFGWALAAGDFDGDTFDDLAIGVPGDSAGAVAVLYGTGTGLAASRNQLWAVGTGGLSGSPAAGDHFGAALCAGDFDGDGRVDLAVGARDADPFSIQNAGAVFELHGSPTGLTGTGSRRWTAFDLTGALGGAGESFGFALACGSFDGGLAAGLAIGSPDVDQAALHDVGVVDVMPGSASGLTALGSQRFSSAGLASAPAADLQLLGYALAAGDLDGNGHADLAIGIPNRVLGVQILRDDADVLFCDGFEAGDTQAWSATVP